MTTDLFLAAAGVDPLVLAGAVPPGCLRGIDPAPIAAREGADTVLMLPTWTPRRPATHLLPSFAPLTEAPLAFRFEISALVGAREFDQQYEWSGHEPAALRAAEQWISERRTSWERRLDRLGEYLAEGNDEPKGGKR